MHKQIFFLSILVFAAAMSGCAADYASSLDYAGYEDPNAATEPTDEALFTDEPLALAPPAAVARYVVIPNFNRNSITRLDTWDLSVDVIEVGPQPNRVFSIQGGTVLATLNQGDSTISIIRDEGTRVETMPLRAGMNDAVIHPQTGWGIAYVDPRQPFDQSRVTSLAEITLFSVLDGTTATLSLGQAPRAIRYGPASNPSVIVATDQQVFHIALPDMTQTRHTVSSTIREMFLSADATQAYLRTGDAALTVLALADGTTSSIPLGGTPSDLDQLQNGLLFGTYAVSDQTRVFGLHTSDATLQHSLLDNVYTQLQANEAGDSLLVYNPERNRVDYVVGDLGAFPYLDPITYATIKPIRSALAAPTGNYFVLEHDECTCEVDDFYDDNEVVSVLDAGNGQNTPMRFPQAVDEWIFGTDAPIAVGRMEQNQQIALVTLPHQWATLVDTPSAPQHMGTIPPRDDEPMRFYISEEHVLGRISLFSIFDIASDFIYERETVTGFELNGQILYAGDEQ